MAGYHGQKHSRPRRVRSNETAYEGAIRRARGFEAFAKSYQRTDERKSRHIYGLIAVLYNSIGSHDDVERIRPFFDQQILNDVGHIPEEDLPKLYVAIGIAINQENS